LREQFENFQRLGADAFKTMGLGRCEVTDEKFVARFDRFAVQLPFAPPDEQGVRVALNALKGACNDKSFAAELGRDGWGENPPLLPAFLMCFGDELGDKTAAL